MTDTFVFGNTVLHLDGVGPITRGVNDVAYWADRDRPALNSGHVLTVFSYCETWTYQERHPDGEELALVLDGVIDVLLDHGDGEVATRVARGEGCVVPAGWWHRVAVRELATILFVTPVPARTEHRDAPRVSPLDRHAG
jgi:hypothetical protein